MAMKMAEIAPRFNGYQIVNTFLCAAFSILVTQLC